MSYYSCSVCRLPASYRLGASLRPLCSLTCYSRIGDRAKALKSMRSDERANWNRARGEPVLVVSGPIGLSVFRVRDSSKTYYIFGENHSAPGCEEERMMTWPVTEKSTNLSVVSIERLLLRWFLMYQDSADKSLDFMLEVFYKDVLPIRRPTSAIPRILDTFIDCIHQNKEECIFSKKRVRLHGIDYRANETHRSPYTDVCDVFADLIVTQDVMKQVQKLYANLANSKYNPNKNEQWEMDMLNDIIDSDHYDTDIQGIPGSIPFKVMSDGKRVVSPTRKQILSVQDETIRAKLIAFYKARVRPSNILIVLYNEPRERLVSRLQLAFERIMLNFALVMDVAGIARSFRFPAADTLVAYMGDKHRHTWVEFFRENFQLEIDEDNIEEEDYADTGCLHLEPEIRQMILNEIGE